MALQLYSPRSRRIGSCAGSSSLVCGAGLLLIASLLAGCAGAAMPNAMSEARFACEGGASFKVEYLPRQVRVTTSAGTYVLASQPSSIGEKYASPSEDVVFIQDEERGVLVGAQGGPFSYCEDESVRTAETLHRRDGDSEQIRSGR